MLRRCAHRAGPPRSLLRCASLQRDPPGRCKNRGLCVPLVSYMEPNVTNEEFLEEIHVLWDWSQAGQGGAQTDLGRAVADSGDQYRGMGRV